MKKIFLSLTLLVALVNPTVANASTVNISSAQNTALTCFNNHTKSAACTKALNIVKFWKPVKSSDSLTVNKNVLIKCLYSKTTKTAACKSAAIYVNNYQNNLANFAQTKSDIQQLQEAITTGIGTGDLTVSNYTGVMALTGMVSSENGNVPIGNAIVYTNINLNQGTGQYCISETSGQTTYKVTHTHSAITTGTPCKSANG